LAGTTYNDVLCVGMRWRDEERK